MSKFREHSLMLALSTALLGACSNPPPRPPEDRTASATLEARSGSAVVGVVNFQTRGSRLYIDARVSGLPQGAHGFHIHETGDCRSFDASSAGGHFNPSGRPHGHPERGEHHAGDLPNLVADRSGYANYAGELEQLSLDGPASIIGRAVVIHADPDDYTSQPAGNSGKRIACGVIRGSLPRS